MAAFQVRIAYLTPLKRSRHYFHQLVLADDRQAALAEGRALLRKRSPEARIVHAAANLRPDSKDAEAVIRAGWRYRDGWWSRPIRAGDDLAAIALHGFADSKAINARSTAGCVEIDCHAGRMAA
ncbi:hypothetical protein QV13_04805 [Mesorhizobium hungaricum]|jgi:hypothetical protein|uniref:Uncharacterized protein n=1 Tax=Mesorhizobium hungaricum TaxID=1566387 RepID=A0A1C2E707_9HYPH|nr:MULTISPECIES: hypothetical protein [Mesorhizobium]MBN9237390.1 hypothetical protein [Mesorhizobium sp.]MDQ0333318.1 hypothetical protein [Mesorhizobium sp. YL-MeA3-2017]OCX22789.1 hypothetical protein QV13_04805 [Mesorhizobium hungaricum]